MKITKIYDKYYDLTNFNHPGGKEAIWHSYNIDSTTLFESYHILSDKKKLLDILNKFAIDTPSEIKLNDNSNILFKYNSNFANDLTKELKNYFKYKSHKATFNRWLLIGFLFILRIISIYYWLNESLIGLFLYPLFSWLSIANTFHDACHFSLSKYAFINKIFSYTGYELSTPLFWFYQHNLGHHMNTNIENKDPDLYHGIYVIRVINSIKYKYQHKFQTITWIILWFLSYIGMIIKPLLDNCIYNYYYKFIEFKDNKLSYIELKDKLLLLFYIIIRYILPFWWFNNKLFIFIPTFIFSFLFMINSQLTHLHENNYKIDKDWYKHQIITSSNFSLKSKIVFIFSGGLNYQIEHHILPGINHCHYPYIQPIIEKLCIKYKIKYNKFESYLDAFKSYFNNISNLSKNN
jgi:fatty acid desaturase